MVIETLLRTSVCIFGIGKTIEHVNRKDEDRSGREQNPVGLQAEIIAQTQQLDTGTKALPYDREKRFRSSDSLQHR